MFSRDHERRVRLELWTAGRACLSQVAGPYKALQKLVLHAVSPGLQELPYNWDTYRGVRLRACFGSQRHHRRDEC